MRARVVLAVLGMAWLSACASASPVSSPTGSPAPISEAACAELDLRSPSGTPVQLTGRWRSPDGATYYIRQSASCVWITGFSVGTGSPAGGGTPAYTNAFFGKLASDFTLPGLWAMMPWGLDRGGGSVTWQIEFADVGGQESMSLVAIEGTGGTDLFLIRPVSPADLHLRLRESGECAAAVSDEGEDYELVVAAPGWEFLQPARVRGPDDQVILPSDAFDVSGEVGQGTGSCGPGLVIFADRIEASSTP